MNQYRQRHYLRNLQTLWSYINKRQRKQLCCLFLLIVCTSLVEIIGIGAVVPLLGVLTAPERVYENELMQPFLRFLELSVPSQLLLPITLIFALVAILSGGLRLTQLFMMTRLTSAIGEDLSNDAYRRTLYQSYLVHTKRNTSDVIATLTGKTNAIVGAILMPILVLISSAVMLIAIVSALIAVEASTALLAFLGFGSIYVLVVLGTKKQLKINGEIVGVELAQVHKALQEGLGGIRDVLLDGTQEAYCTTFKAADKPLRRATSNILIIGAGPRFVIEALGMVLIAGLAYVFATRSEGIYSALPLLGVIALSAQRLLPVLQQCYSNWTLIRSAQTTLADVLELLAQPLPNYLNSKSDSSLTFTKCIKLDDVSFRYSANGAWVLKNITIELPKSARVGFIGKTGGGKSTLLDIVMGLLAPTSGRLYIDEHAVDYETAQAWQKHIAHVPQAIFLADTDIAQNIALGVSPDQIDYVRVRRAASQAQIADLVDSLPEGYQTFVGERGVRLSGGQRQRIGIARALYKNADVIVFDEATSALDVNTEAAVMEVIENLSKDLTILIVAHRLSTLSGCTQIIELEAAEIKRLSSFEDLDVK
jgi:ABC-type multidrug transport system fused ATPase/permease subunit